MQATIEELLDVSSSMRSVSYQVKQTISSYRNFLQFTKFHNKSQQISEVGGQLRYLIKSGRSPFSHETAGHHSYRETSMPVTLCIINLDTRQTWVINFKPRQL
jgi:hypothetical protein